MERPPSSFHFASPKTPEEVESFKSLTYPLPRLLHPLFPSPLVFSSHSSLYPVLLTVFFSHSLLCLYSFFCLRPPLYISYVSFYSHFSPSFFILSTYSPPLPSLLVLCSHSFINSYSSYILPLAYFSSLQILTHQTPSEAQRRDPPMYSCFSCSLASNSIRKLPTEAADAMRFSCCSASSTTQPTASTTCEHRYCGETEVISGSRNLRYRGD